MAGHEKGVAPATLEPARSDTPRERVWAIIRAQRTFSVRSIRDALPGGRSRPSIRNYVIALRRAGYLRPIEGGRYELVRDVGVEAPRVRSDGSEASANRGREQIWRTLRMLGEFSARDLAIAASTEECPVSEAAAGQYLRPLARAGYVVAVRRGRQVCYRAIKSRCTGSRPPIVRRATGQVFDPNTGEVTDVEDRS